MQERKYKIKDNQLVKKSDETPIPDDEPLFILRAQDRKSLAVLCVYLMTLDDINHKASVNKSIEDFRAFQAQHPERMKEPDTEPEYKFKN